MKGKEETAPKLSNGTILNDLQWPFQVHDYSTSNNLQHTTYNRELYLQWPTNRKSYGLAIERRHFQWPWTTLTPSFKIMPFFDAEYIRNGTTYRHDVIEILIGTYTRRHNVISNDLDDLESDLAKYSTTRSVERSLCDSWASCFNGIPWVTCNPDISRSRHI